MDNYIEEIFLTLNRMNSSERKEIEEVLNLLAEKLADPISKVLSNATKIIWTDTKHAIIYQPTTKKFLYTTYIENSTNNELSEISETLFWNAADEIIKWIIDMNRKLKEIHFDRQNTFSNFLDMKSKMIQCEKEETLDLGMGFFKNESDDN